MCGWRGKGGKILKEKKTFHIRRMDENYQPLYKTNTQSQSIHANQRKLRYSKHRAQKIYERINNSIL